MPEIHVEKLSLGETQKGKQKTGLYANGEWYNLFDHHPGLENKTVTLKEGKFKGWYDLVSVVAPQSNGNGAAAEAPTSNGQHTGMEWEDFEATVKAAAALVREAEPDVIDDTGATAVDRSPARASILCTIIIAISQGKIGPALPF